MAASTFDRLPRPSSGVCRRPAPAVVTSAPPPSTPRCHVMTRARRRRRRCRTSRPCRRNRARPLHDARVVGVGDEHVRRAPLSRISAFASAIASADAKNPRCASPTLVHTRTSGSAMPTSVRISPAMIHPELDDGDPAAWRELKEREGRPIWLFRLPLFLKHPEARRQELRDDFLGRRLARAAGDRHHLGAGAAPHVTGEILQRPRRVLDLDDAAPASPFLPRRRRRLVDHRADGPTSSAHRHELGARRTFAADRHEEVARLERARVDRHAADGGRGVAAADRPPVAFATSLALKGSHSTCQHTRLPARRRSSAVLATSTSSNGSTRSPITWYFSWPLPAIRIRSPGCASAPPARSPPCDRRSPGSGVLAAAAPPAAIVGRHDAALDLLDDVRRDPRTAGCRRSRRPGRSGAPPRRPSAAAWSGRDRRRSRTP